MKLLDGKVVLVTGGSRGIGAATSKIFAMQGAKVAVNYYDKADEENPESADLLIKEIEALGGVAMAIQADITNRSEVLTMVHIIEQKYGEITTLVLNAFLPFQPKPFAEMSWEIFEGKLVPDMKAIFHVSQAVLPAMIKNRSGSIIAVSSGLSRLPTHEFMAYSVSKSALNAFVRSLAFELGPHGIRVNTIAPGFTSTQANQHTPEFVKQEIANSTPLRRVAIPEDIANAILYYAMEQSKFITGSYLTVDGGITML